MLKSMYKTGRRDWQKRSKRRRLHKSSKYPKEGATTQPETVRVPWYTSVSQPNLCMSGGCKATGQQNKQANNWILYAVTHNQGNSKPWAEPDANEERLASQSNDKQPDGYKIKQRCRFESTWSGTMVSNTGKTHTCFDANAYKLPVLSLAGGQHW